jgi:D-amino-acid oxidase
MELPAVDMPVYLGWLQRRVEALGGRVESRVVASLDEALAEAPAVVNCSGLAARELADDRQVYAARGQVVHVRAPDVDRFVLDNYGPDGMAYVIPRTEVVVLGGTSEDGDENLDADDVTTAGILERCAAIEPRVRGAEVVAVKVGLRPCRTTVRLEPERRGTGVIIHNYGHGGAGVTLSWGCAQEVAELVATAS